MIMKEVNTIWGGAFASDWYQREIDADDGAFYLW